MKQKEKDFLKNFAKLCKKHKIKFVKTNKAYIVEDGIKCSGYFDEENKIVKVATGRPFKAWFPILLHESCHVDQWLETKFVDLKYNGQDISTLSEEWIVGNIELSKKAIDSIHNKLRNLELDCEKRTVRKIKELDLDINVEEYIQKANSYIYFYNLIKETRKWYKIRPHGKKEIWSQFPKHFNNDYTKLRPKHKAILKKAI